MARDQENRSPELVIVMIVMLSMSYISFSLRAWVRIRVIKAPGLDDLLTFLGLIMFTVNGFWVFYGAHYGTGKHMEALSPENIRKAFMAFYLQEAFYIVASGLLKVAVGLFLLRIAIQKPHRLVIWTLIGLNAVLYVYAFFQSIFQCSPPSFYWMRFDPNIHGKCGDPVLQISSGYTLTGLGIVTDWTYAILPIFIVWNLKINRKKKIGVLMILSLAAAASVTTFVRIPYLVNLTHTTDFLFQTVDIAIWSTLEEGIGITAVSLATLRPLVRSFLARFGVSGFDSSRSGGYSRSRGFPDAERWHYPHRDPSDFYFKFDSLDASTSDGVGSSRARKDILKTVHLEIQHPERQGSEEALR